MLRDNIRRALDEGTITFEQASDVLAKASRHAGGRPKGVTNRGPDKLDRAIVALSATLYEVQAEDYLDIAEKLLEAQSRADNPPERDGTWRDDGTGRAVLTPFREMDRQEDLALVAQYREVLRLPPTEDSQARMAAMITKKWSWNNRRVLREVRRRGALSEELAVVLAYKRSEERAGMSRLTRVKGMLQGMGAGPVAKIVGDVETVKEAVGRVRKTRHSTPTRRRAHGYKVVPEPFIERSLSTLQEPVMLWGADVTTAIQEELGFEPIQRRGNGRRWLAPVELTQEHAVHRSDGTEIIWVGAGSGANGLTLDNAGLVSEATLGELRQSELWRDRVRGGLPYEPDGRYVRYETKPGRFDIWYRRLAKLKSIGVDSLKLDGGGTRLIGIDVACIRPEQFDLDCLWPTPVQAAVHKELQLVATSYHAPVHVEQPLRGVVRPYGDKDSRYWATPSIPMEPMPRCDGELRAGRCTTRWREDENEKWRKPKGFLPAPPIDDPDLIGFVNEMTCLQRWRADGCLLPIISPPNGRVDFLPRKAQGPHIVSNMADARPASIVWWEDGEPMRGTMEWAERRRQLWRSRLDHWVEPVAKPDRAAGWNVLPILYPPCGFEVLFPDLIA